jgi:hypothetical protein
LAALATDIIPVGNHPGGALLVNKTVTHLLHNYAPTRGFNPPMKPPKVHPIEEKIKKDGSRVCLVYCIYL